MMYGLLEKILEILPNCRMALHLSETGQQRPLKLVEKLLLHYHRPLCPFCACNKNKFESLEKKRKQAETRRSH